MLNINWHHKYKIDNLNLLKLSRTASLLSSPNSPNLKELKMRNLEGNIPPKIPLINCSHSSSRKQLNKINQTILIPFPLLPSFPSIQRHLSRLGVYYNQGSLVFMLNYHSIKSQCPYIYLDIVPVNIQRKYLLFPKYYLITVIWYFSPMKKWHVLIKSSQLIATTKMTI